jgi:hypothetical protein
MPIKKYICIGILPPKTAKLKKIREGLAHDLKGVWLSREAIDTISAMEHFDV